ncbi:MAG: hypothetical protein IIV78_03675 [Oscillospiraceae bacterium]|nr:hypothetical protein [Oscillospiraceae bacterium]
MKRVFLWLALIHVLTSLAGLGSVYLALASFGGGSDSAFMALCMLLLWFVGGLLAARKLRFGVGFAAAAAAFWAALMYLLELAAGNYWFSLPQYVTGIGLAYLLPVDQYSAWFFEVLKPAMAVAAHILLPLFFALGVFARKLYEKNKEN